MMKKKKVALLASIILAIGLVAAACGGGGLGPTEAPEATNAPLPAASTPVPDSGLSAVVSNTPDVESFNPATAHFEGYWYSRYNLGHLVMRSGLGIQLMPPPGKMMAMMEMAGISEGPANPFMLQAVYASGDPHLATQFNGNENDFSNYRWAPEEMDTTITPQAMAYTIIKEVIWAKSFASDVEGASPMNHFRALALSAGAAAQTSFAMTNLMSSEGLFVPAWRDGQLVGGRPAAQDQFAMLWAISELADYASGRYGWYAAPLPSEKAQATADGLLTAIVGYDKENPGFLRGLPTRDLGLALSAVSSYAGYAHEGPSRTQALVKVVPTLADEIVGRMDEDGRLASDGGFSQVSTQATAIQGLVYAYISTDDASYREAAISSWRHMETLWDEESGLYAPFPGAVDYNYHIRDVGDVSGAANALLNGLSMDVDQRYADFFNTVVNRSGLVLAESAITGGDQDEDGIPVPAGAGGAYGQAPVFATQAVYHKKTGKWELKDPRFTTAEAMYASNQMMWMSAWAGKPAVAGHGLPVLREAS